MRCYREEIFGPVPICLSVDNIDESIELINADEYGNGIAIFTSSSSLGSYLQKKIEVGQVSINVPILLLLPMFSFMGDKRGVAGRGSSTFYGKSALSFYTQTSTVKSLRKVNSGVGFRAPVSVNMPTQT